MSRSRTLQVLLALLEGLRDHVADEPLGERHRVVEVREGDLGLHHPELGEVPPGLRLLRAERRPEAVDLAVRGGGRLVVELPALREVRRALVEVRHPEEGRRALAGRRGEDRRVGQDVALVVEVVAHGLDHRVADAGDRVLARRAQPQVAVLHEKRRPVVLRRDRVVVDALQHGGRGHVHLVPAGRALVLPHVAGELDRGLLPRLVERLPGLGRDRLLRDDGLREARPVADDQELQLPARALVVDPAADEHFLPRVAPELLDAHRLHGDLVSVSRAPERAGGACARAAPAPGSARGCAARGRGCAGCRAGTRGCSAPSPCSRRSPAPSGSFART